VILVDTSVFIDYLQGNPTEKASYLDYLIENDESLAISSYTYLEILQGARDKAEFKKLDTYFSGLRIVALKGKNSFREAAQLFFDLRRKGKTVRSTIDVLIALTAIQNKLWLLHDDRDFDVIKEHDRRLVTLDWAGDLPA